MNTLQKRLCKHLENSIIQVIRTGDKQACLDLVKGTLVAVTNSLHSLRTANFKPDVFTRLKIDERIVLMLEITRLKEELAAWPE